MIKLRTVVIVVIIYFTFVIFNKRFALSRTEVIVIISLISFYIVATMQIGRLVVHNIIVLLLQFAIVDDVGTLALAALDGVGSLQLYLGRDAEHALQFLGKLLLQSVDGSGRIECTSEELLTDFHLHL